MRREPEAYRSRTPSVASRRMGTIVFAIVRIDRTPPRLLVRKTPMHSHNAKVRGIPPRAVAQARTLSELLTQRGGP